MKRKEEKKVERILEEVKFIKRFINLNNKKKSPNEILSFIKSLQRSIVQKLIRKTSPLASEIESIQHYLIKAYKNMRGEQVISIPTDDIARMIDIAGGEKVYPSIYIIKRFISLQGQQQEKKKIEALASALENAFKNGKIGKNDPYAKEIKYIHSKLTNRVGNTISVSNQQLHGLESIAKSCKCNKDLGQIYRIKKSKAEKIKGLRPCRKKSFTDSKNKGACSHNGGLSGVLTAEEMASRKLDLLEFSSFWADLFGNPGRNFTMMFHGEPGNGKTILLLKFSQYLAETFGSVLYISSEEFSSPTMTKKVQDVLTARPERLHFAENLKQPDLSQYDFIILDSVNHLKVKESDYDKLRAKYPKAAFLFILQHTKGGYFKGGKDWEHNAEIVAEVSKGIITITKNRYAPNSSLNFFRQFGIEWKKKLSSEAPSYSGSTPKPYPIIDEMNQIPSEDTASTDDGDIN
jgi:DNA replication protein DnaC